MFQLKKVFLSWLIVASFLLNFPGISFAAKEDAQALAAPKSIAVDTKGTGKPDRWEYYENAVLVRIEADTNGDGKIDEWAEVKDGKIVGAKKDSNYDGKVDRWITY